jgi:hypothetical protein
MTIIRCQPHQQKGGHHGKEGREEKEEILQKERL